MITANNDIRQRIGQRIAELRKLRGMTQRDLAAATGFNPSNIGRIERGRYSVGLEVLNKIAEALDSRIEINEK